MKFILIADYGDKYFKDIRTNYFDTESKLLEFVNKEVACMKIICCYEIAREVIIEPFEKVTQYRIKD